VFYHFQRPEDPDDVDALNCYAAADACNGCKAPLTLEPLVIPPLAEVLGSLETSGSSR
jgi:hypothetical protein